MDLANQAISSGADQITVLSRQFADLVQKNHSITLPHNFLELSVKAMTHLQQCGRTNILYGLAKGLGTLRPDKSDSKFPAKRMPAGLLQYMVEFFAADNLSQVIIPNNNSASLCNKFYSVCLLPITGSTLSC